MFSILIPTWNNLEYLRLCIDSIRKNSSHAHQILVHVNEGKDGTREWVKSQGIRASFSENNIGICDAVNHLAALSTSEYVVYMNDDMYCCPGWDEPLLCKAKSLNTDLFMLSGTMVEPTASRNPCVVNADFGKDVASFDEAGLLRALPGLRRSNWLGSTWPPTLVRTNIWHRVGGYSTEFSPGMSSDNDFSMKIWQAGCRIFLGLGESLVYHFQCRSTGKVVKNDGRKQFLRKWGISQSAFDTHFLQRGRLADGQDILPGPKNSLGWRFAKLRGEFKRSLT